MEELERNGAEDAWAESGIFRRALPRDMSSLLIVFQPPCSSACVRRAAGFSLQDVEVWCGWSDESMKTLIPRYRSSAREALTVREPLSRSPAQLPYQRPQNDALVRHFFSINLVLYLMSYIYLYLIIL